MIASRIFSTVICLWMCLQFAGGAKTPNSQSNWSEVYCNRTSRGDACLIKNACINGETVELFHESADSPASLETAFLPVPTRGCRSEECRFLAFAHFFNITWKEGANNLNDNKEGDGSSSSFSTQRTVTIADHPLFMTFLKPNHASFPHFIEDLVLPIYETMTRVDGKVNLHSQVLFLGYKADLWMGGVGRELMGVLSIGAVRFLSDIVGDGGRLCFSRAVIGSYSEIRLEQAALPTHKDFVTRMKIVQRFRDHVLSSLDITPLPPPTSPSALIVSRPWPRAILNEHEVSDALTAAKIPTEIIDFAKLRLREQIQAVRRHSILIGVTGAGLLLSMFMHNPSAVIVVFPYGTHPYRSFAECDLGIEYNVLYNLAHAKELPTGKGELLGEWIRWENMHFENTFTYWHQPHSLEGEYFAGNRIWLSAEKECASLWGFHQNQDTILVPEEIVRLAGDAAERMKPRMR